MPKPPLRVSPAARTDLEPVFAPERGRGAVREAAYIDLAGPSPASGPPPSVLCSSPTTVMGSCRGRLALGEGRRVVMDTTAADADQRVRFVRADAS